MIDVLLVAGTVPRPDSFTASLRGLAAPDVRIRAAGFCAAADIPDAEQLVLRHSFAADANAHGKRFAQAARKAQAPRRIWMYAERNAELRALARKAKVIVALDTQAVYTVWQLAQLNRAAHACFGVAAATRAVAERRARPAHFARADFVASLPDPAQLARKAGRRAVRVPKAVAGRAVGARVLRTGPGARLWRAAVTAPGLPDDVRFKLARRVGDGMRRANRPSGAVLALTGAAGRTRSPRRRADLLGEAARLDLARGQAPERLMDAVTAELDCADALLAGGKKKQAAASVIRAMDLAFHRVLHFDRTDSPLADAPDAFPAPLWRSGAVEALSRTAGRKTPVAAPPAGRPLRLLFAVRRNDHFLGEIRGRYENHPDVEVRTVDVADEPVLNKLSMNRIAEYRLGAAPEVGPQIEEHLRPHLDWADVVFVDWCTAAAALFTAVDPGGARIVVRLHSYETFSHWPYLVDFSRVDDLIFVGAHLRDLTVAAVPRLRQDGAPRLHVIPNAMDLGRYELPKDPEARFTLGLIGISAVAKDPRWAIEVLRLLRADDERYRLFLIGSDVDATLSPAARAYAKEYERDLADLEKAGAVRRLGQLEDVPAALKEVGVILSSSVRESFHCGFVEGAASGAVPVGRDWPFFAGRAEGARTLFPADWVVASPREAADRIRALTESEEVWRKHGQAAAEHAVTTWDWPVVARAFDGLLLNGTDEDAAAGEG
ncbi:glycosyltransferase [Streptomyces sp. NPDC047928]|uniref:glycosyltransferase family protein n=1 Tax=unclassified Streptomyces TaxID=2593676 RepID=UPI003720F2F0